MKHYLVMMIVPVLALGACGSGVKKTLGLERNQPDEFAVVERAPLTMPPNFSLAPPRPGVMRSADAQSDVAKGLVLGSESSAPVPAASNAVSRSENLLLSKAGATQVDPSIRQKLADPMPEDPNTVAEKLGMTDTDSQGKAINPTEEAKRLQKANVKTVPVTTAPKKDAPQTNAK